MKERNVYRLNDKDVCLNKVSFELSDCPNERVFVSHRENQALC